MMAAATPEPAVLPAATRDAIKRAVDDGRLFAPRPYQADRLASESRFNLDNWSRQTGKSFTAGVDSVLLAGATATLVMQLSASLDQTKELMLKTAIAAEAVMGVAGEIQREVMSGALDETLYVEDLDGGGGTSGGIRITQTVIDLGGGVRIVGRPANPRTARGFSGHVKLDEFGMHLDPDEIWAAAAPSITSDPRLRLDVMSTPGIRTDDKFAQLCLGAERGDNDFAYRRVTIHDAIADGLDADADELKRQLGDEDRWRREYLCEFVDEAGALLTYDLIRGCQHEGLTKALPADPRHWDEAGLGWNPDEGTLYAGIDFGRRHDLTVIWLGQMLGDVLWTRAIVELRNVDFTQQLDLIELILGTLPVRRACVDQTGMGEAPVDILVRRFGSKVEGVKFSAPVKAELAEPFRGRFQDRLIRVPIDATLTEDLHSIRKSVTAAGNVRYLGERTADGHADRFWAGALCNHAAKARGDGPGGMLTW